MAAKIAIVIPWYGPWPSWMPAFLLTCKYNDSIVFIIPGETAPPSSAPNNVRFVPLTLDEISARASSVFGFPLRIASPYKLCDFKPFYGRIFAHELEGFDFWGHSDLDVLWGEIRKYVTPAVTERYDVICGSDSGVIGHFTLYRNTAALSEYLKKMPGLRRLLNAPEYKEVDELWSNAWLHEGLAGSLSIAVRKAAYKLLSGRAGSALFGRFASNYLLYCKLFFFPRRSEYSAATAGMPDRHLRLYKRQLHKPGYDMSRERSTVCFSWSEGRLVEKNGREWMYLHFVEHKNGLVRLNFSDPTAAVAFTFSGEENGCSILV